MPVPEQIVQNYANHMVPGQRQMPVFSHVGKGEKGDSCWIRLDEDGFLSSIKAFQYNEQHPEMEAIETMSVPLLNLIPKPHFNMYRGVRDEDQSGNPFGAAMWVYWIEFWFDISMYGSTLRWWSFTTPYTEIAPYYDNAPYPDDELIDSSENE